MPEKKAKPGNGRGRGKSGWEWVAFYLLAGVLLGALGGLGLDHLLGTTPLFLIVGIFTGFALGLYGVYKSS